MPGSVYGGGRLQLTGDGFLSGLGRVLRVAAPIAASFIPGAGALGALARAGSTAQRVAQVARVALPALAAAGAPSRGEALARSGQAIARVPSFPLPRFERDPRPMPPPIRTDARFRTEVIGRRRFRRMNPLNPKALRRATRRLAGFHSFAVATERELRKLAPMKRTAVGRKPCR